MVKYRCSNCQDIEVKGSTCPHCRGRAYPAMSEIYWCSHCQTPTYYPVCRLCNSKAKRISTDLRPVFPEERILLETILSLSHGVEVSLAGKHIWNGSGNIYYANGERLDIKISSLIFAFISAIIDLAKEKINEKALEDSDLIDTTEEGYPIVMDAPLSAFDKTRIKSICTEIPRIADQVIIFIKDTDGDIAEEHMEAKIGKRYLIRQVDGSKLHSKVIGR